MWPRIGLIILKVALSIAAFILLAKPSMSLLSAMGHKYSSAPHMFAAFLPTLIAIWWGSASIVRRFTAVLISVPAGIALWHLGDLFIDATNPGMSSQIVALFRTSAPLLAIVLSVAILRNVRGSGSASSRKRSAGILR